MGLIFFLFFRKRIFLFVFLPIFVTCYFFTPNKFKNLCILLWSYLFYCWGALAIVGLLLISSIADYLLSHCIYRATENRSRHIFLSMSLTINLAALAYFKYANFFIQELNSLLAFSNQGQISWAEVALPIGISFFTFQKISYMVDVYRKVVTPAQSFTNYALYVALFPQLIAGPIIRYHDINKQIENRNHSIEDVFYGIYRFSRGLAKKVLIADTMGAVANNIFALPSESLTLGYAWLGALAYAYQIYFDFSGYSDMAIGLGRIMGFHFLENFNMPYISQSITEFWRRWHISLSNWMREYLYIPLGGNRVSPARIYLNLWIVFLLSGLWHGASWNFIAWGMFHGVFLTVDKIFWLKKSKSLPAVINTLAAFFLVLVSWVIFRSETLVEAGRYLYHMFSFSGALQTQPLAPRAMIIDNRGITILLIATVLSFSPLFFDLSSIRTKLNPRIPKPVIHTVRFAGSFACVILSALTLATTNFNPFIYFRF